MRPSWITQIGPDPNGKCPYKRHKRSSQRHRGEGHAKMEAKPGVSNHKPKNEDSNPTLQEARNRDSLLELLREHSPLDTLVLDFWPPKCQRSELFFQATEFVIIFYSSHRIPIQ